jgi:hypothetical protein
MKITVKHLLQILPLDEDLKWDLLGKFDSLSDDQKFEIRKLCWSMYFTLLKNKERYELEKTLSEIKENKRKMSSKLFNEIKEKIDKEFKIKIHEADQVIEIEKARNDILQIIKKNSPPSR